MASPLTKDLNQFDNYRVNMRESLQREVEENIHKVCHTSHLLERKAPRESLPISIIVHYAVPLG